MVTRPMDGLWMYIYICIHNPSTGPLGVVCVVKHTMVAVRNEPSIVRQMLPLHGTNDQSNPRRNLYGADAMLRKITLQFFKGKYF